MAEHSHDRHGRTPYYDPDYSGVHPLLELQ